MPATVRAVMMLAIAGTALLQAADEPAWAQTQAAFSFGDTLTATSAALERAAAAAKTWIGASYARRPLVMIGLAGVLLLPLLVVTGLLLYRKRSTAPLSLSLADADPGAIITAWLEIDGARRIVIPPERHFLQIGRSRDNDVCLEDETVHRYHAVIERKRGRGFTITDIGSADGSSLTINGARLPSAVLADGDTIELGRARLRFAIAA